MSCLKHKHDCTIFIAQKIKITFLLLAALLFTLIACQDIERPPKPDNLIAVDAMSKIFTEAYLMNAARSIENRTILKKGILLDSIIYANHAIDSLQFAQSNAYYSADLDTYKTIFLEAERMLNLEKAKRDTLYAQYQRKEAVKRKVDSIREVHIDSMQKELPKIKRDSLYKLLKEHELKLDTIKTKISSKKVLSQDTIL